MSDCTAYSYIASDCTSDDDSDHHTSSNARNTSCTYAPFCGDDACNYAYRTENEDEREMRREYENCKPNDKFGLDKKEYYQNRFMFKGKYHRLECHIFDGDVNILLSNLQTIRRHDEEIIFDRSYPNLIAAYRSGNIDMVRKVFDLGAAANTLVDGRSPLQHAIRYDIEHNNVINIGIVDLMLKEMGDGVSSSFFEDILREFEFHDSNNYGNYTSYGDIHDLYVQDAQLTLYYSSFLSMIELFKDYNIRVPTCHLGETACLARIPHLVGALMQYNPDYYATVEFTHSEIKSMFERYTDLNYNSLIFTLCNTNSSISTALQSKTCYIPVELLNAALYADNKEVFSYIIANNGSIVDIITSSPSHIISFCTAAINSELLADSEVFALLRACIESPNVDVNGVDNDGASILHALCQNINASDSFVSLITSVIERSTVKALNSTDNMGRTALGVLVSSTPLETFCSALVRLVELFIQRGCDVNSHRPGSILKEVVQQMRNSLFWEEAVSAGNIISLITTLANLTSEAGLLEAFTEMFCLPVYMTRGMSKDAEEIG